MVKIIKLLFADIYTNVFGYRGEYKDLRCCTSKIYQNQLDENTCDELVAIIDRLCASGDKYLWVDNEGADARIWSFERHIESQIYKLDVNKKIQEIEKYTGRKINSWLIMANRISAVENNRGSGGGWHRDSPYAHQVKCIWYLNDVSENNGPFEYIPDSNVNLIKKINTIGSYRYSEDFEQGNAVSCSKGTLLVSDTRCIHRGRPLVNGKRYALTLYALPNENGKDKLLGDLDS